MYQCSICEKQYEDVELATKCCWDEIKTLDVKRIQDKKDDSQLNEVEKYVKGNMNQG